MTHTEEQTRVFNFVKYDSSHGIIDAVAGSGKTTTIVESVNFIDSSKKILFCAFNNSISKEISQRFAFKNLTNVKVKTLHGLGFNLLKINSALEYKIENNKYDKLIEQFLKQRDAADSIEQLCLLNKISLNPQNKIEELQLKTFYNVLKQILIDICNKVRLTLSKPELEEFKKLLIHYNILNEKKSSASVFDNEAKVYFDLSKKIINKGNELALKLNLIDFSDMLYLPYVNKLSPIHKFDLLFIDECQDLSKSQLYVALKYVKKDGRILSVGDPSQSIYGFTGADIESFQRIANLPNTITLSLSKCFRCPSNVIELAQHFRSDIYPFEKKEGNIQVIKLSQVTEKAKATNLIISRTKAPLHKLIFKLIENDTTIEVHEDEVKEFINDLRFLFSSDELNELSIYSKGNNFFEKVKDRNIYFLEKKSFRYKNKEERQAYIEEESNLLELKIDFIKKQLSKQANVQTINDLLKRIERLVSGGKDAIKLSTIHRAKGLENETVFILDYDKLPLYRDGQKDWEKTQENNLKYVALTRTKKNLYLVNSEEISKQNDNNSLFDMIGDVW